MVFSATNGWAEDEVGSPGEAMGLGSVPLLAQALIGLELETVLVEVFVEALALTTTYE